MTSSVIESIHHGQEMNRFSSATQCSTGAPSGEHSKKAAQPRCSARAAAEHHGEGVGCDMRARQLTRCGHRCPPLRCPLLEKRTLPSACCRTTKSSERSRNMALFDFEISVFRRVFARSIYSSTSVLNTDVH